MQRADAGDVQGGRFLQQGLHRAAVFAADIEIVPAGLARPVIVLVAVETGIQRPEFAEGIGGKEGLRGGLIRDHHLRPVHHRRRDELQAAGPQVQDISFLEGNGTIRKIKTVKELTQHLDRFGRSGQFDLGPGFEDLTDQRRVVRLHVVDDQIIRSTAGQGLFQVLLPLPALAGVDSIEDGNLSPIQQVGIVRHSVGDGILALEQVQVVVLGSDIQEAGLDFTYHTGKSFFFTKIQDLCLFYHFFIPAGPPFA